MILSRLLDNICTLRDALGEHEGNRKQQTLRDLRTHLALALVALCRENRELGGPAAVNVEHYEEREEARVSYVVDLTTDPGLISYAGLTGT